MCSDRDQIGSAQTVRRSVEFLGPGHHGRSSVPTSEKKKFQSRHGHSGWEKYLKLSEFGIGTYYQVHTYNLCISDFEIVSKRSGQFRDLPIISQLGKAQIPQIVMRYVQIVRKHAQLRYF